MHVWCDIRCNSCQAAVKWPLDGASKGLWWWGCFHLRACSCLEASSRKNNTLAAGVCCHEHAGQPVHGGRARQHPRGAGHPGAWPGRRVPGLALPLRRGACWQMQCCCRSRSFTRIDAASGAGHLITHFCCAPGHVSCQWRHPTSTGEVLLALQMEWRPGCRPLG